MVVVYMYYVAARRSPYGFENLPPATA